MSDNDAKPCPLCKQPFVGEMRDHAATSATHKIAVYLLLGNLSQQALAKEQEPK